MREKQKEHEKKAKNMREKQEEYKRKARRT